MDNNRLRNDNQNEQVSRNTPPRPPALPKSYLGTQGTPKPPVIKKSVPKPEVSIEGVNKGVTPQQSIERTIPKNQEADVVVSKGEEGETSNITASSSTSEKSSSQGHYVRYSEKSSIFKALAVVLAIVFVIGGGMFLLFYGSLQKGAEDVTIINKPNANIRDLDSFKKYKNLEEIRLYNSGIQDIAGIKDLTKLKVVYLRQNDITDISALKDLKKVEYLHLEDNNITDISALAELTNLKVLYIGHNKIKDLSPLEKLVNLEELDLSYNEIEDVSPLANLTKLRRLKLNNNKIENIEGLRNLTELRDLYLRDNGDIKDLTPLIGMHKMEWASFNPPSLELDIIYELKEANPDAIYYFYYRGDYIYAYEDFIYDPGPPPEPGDRKKVGQD